MPRENFSDEKENVRTSKGGCKCNKQKSQVTQSLKLLPPTIIISHTTNRHALGDIVSDENKMKCKTKERSRSSSNEKKDKKSTECVLTKQRRCSTSIMSDILHDSNILTRQNVMTGGSIPLKQTADPLQNLYKKEITKILKEDKISSNKISTNMLDPNKRFPIIKRLLKSPAASSTQYNIDSVGTIKNSHTNKIGVLNRDKETIVKTHSCLTSTELRKEKITNVVTSKIKSSNYCQKIKISHEKRKTIAHIPFTESVIDKKNVVYEDLSKNTQPKKLSEGKKYSELSGASMITENSKIKPKLKLSHIMNNAFLLERTPKEKKKNNVLTSIPPAIIKNINFERGIGISSASSKYSPILPNRFTDENILITKKPETLRKPKIKRRNSRNYTHAMKELSYVGDIYNEEYLFDIFENIKLLEKKIVLKDDFLQNYNPDVKCRSGIINWLLKMQSNLHFIEGEFYLAVNLFDIVLAKIQVPLNMYQLLIMSTLWIAMKHIGSLNIRASTLISFSEGAYLIQQLLNMEKKVLKIMDFQIHSIEPSICVNYFLKLFDLDENDLAKQSVYYILDCFSLTPEFSSTPISILAAASVNFTFSIYYEDIREKVDMIFRRILSEEELKIVKLVENQIHFQLVNMADENYIFKEPYIKYGGQNTKLGNLSKLSN